ncbi:MAG: DUF1887 family CARF protein [Paludibacteraceae bacterium]|jgi:hypothetical protein|nr:DUF1887 family CARF protein [Paludibacteraceae bacterium]
MKVHITLVGGQPAPVYNGIKADNPDKVIYVYSNDKQSLKSLNSLRNEIKIEEAETLPPLSPTDPNEIENLVSYLAEKYKDDEIVVNISSGLKSWSHIFGYHFQNQENASVIYMDQNNVLWNYKTKQSSSDFNFDMFTLFRLYGNPLEKYTRLSDYNEADKEVAKKIEGIRNTNPSDFNKLLAVLEGSKKGLITNKTGKFDLPTGSYVEWIKATKDSDAFVRICLFNKKGVSEVELESPHAFELAFNSGWFEYKIASILSTWKHAKDICLNCRFPFKNNIDKNEVDIIVNTGTKLLFVECKTQITKPTDIDKFRTVVKTYGGLGAKSLFVTDAAKSEVAKKKCEDYEIIDYSLKEGQGKILQLLNDELEKINAR